LIGKDEDDEAVHYFMDILPRIKKKAAALRDTEEYRNFACYEFTQNEGETVFVPNGWCVGVHSLPSCFSPFLFAFLLSLFR